MRKKVIKNLKIYMKSHYLCEIRPKLHKSHLAVYTGLLTSLMMNGIFVNTTSVEADDVIEEQIIEPIDSEEDSFTDQLVERMIQGHQDYQIGKEDYDRYVQSLSRHYRVNKHAIYQLLDQTMPYLLTQNDFEKTVQGIIESNIQEGNLESRPLPDVTRKEKIRLTTYQYTPNGSDKQLGGSLGLIEPYLKDGSIYYDENGFAMYKGGTKSKHNGVVYGEKGKDYVIVATATEYLIGPNYKKNDKITYYSYNDTFKLEITTKHGTKQYDALVLDSCGASMDWSVTSSGKYAPDTKKEKDYCRNTNNKKIDVFTAPKGFSRLENPKDTAYQVMTVKSEPEKIEKLTSNALKYIKHSFEEKKLYSAKIKILV